MVATSNKSVLINVLISYEATDLARNLILTGTYRGYSSFSTAQMKLKQL